MADFLSLSLVDLLTVFGVLIAPVDVWVIGEVKFSWVVLVFDFVFKGLYQSVSHALLTAGFGEFTAAGLVAGVVTVLALTLDALLVCSVGLIGVAKHVWII